MNTESKTPETAAAAVKAMFQDLVPGCIMDFALARHWLSPRRAALFVQEQVNGVDPFRGVLHDGPCSLDEAAGAVKKVIPELWAEHFLAEELKNELSIV